MVRIVLARSVRVGVVSASIVRSAVAGSVVGTTSTMSQSPRGNWWPWLKAISVAVWAFSATVSMVVGGVAGEPVTATLRRMTRTGWVKVFG